MGQPPVGPPPYPYQQFGQPPTGYPSPAGPFQPAAMAAPTGGRRRGLLIGLVVLVLVLIGGGATTFLLTRDTSKGQATPTAAVAGFFDAVYTDHNVTEASKYVCADSRDAGKLTAKINQLKKQDDAYENPRYSWSTPKAQQNGPDEAILTTTVTVATSNEQKASQNLRVVATRHNGWWVCEIQQTG
jgi:hypothetical protein